MFLNLSRTAYKLTKLWLVSGTILCVGITFLIGANADGNELAEGEQHRIASAFLITFSLVFLGLFLSGLFGTIGIVLKESEAARESYLQNAFLVLFGGYALASVVYVYISQILL